MHVMVWLQIIIWRIEDPVNGRIYVSSGYNVLTTTHIFWQIM